MSIIPAMTSNRCYFPAQAIRDLLIVLGDLFYPYCTGLKGVNRRNDIFEYKYGVVPILGNC